MSSKSNKVKKSMKLQKAKKNKKLEKYFEKYLKATLIDDPCLSENQCLDLQVQISEFMQSEPISKQVFKKKRLKSFLIVDLTPRLKAG